ncbi:uncharacterized protein LOC127286851 [Leptopilina boulardi]|uniref:uncharacterized protein LOC127286851 n=1 Tax=Leptopilina boulardi TaxID=63433 RepID=UPI0021F64693|nr:uncharacterized protein LOC127286851 [Leptopilina boulardi]
MSTGGDHSYFKYKYYKDDKDFNPKFIREEESKKIMAEIQDFSDYEDEFYDDRGDDEMLIDLVRGYPCLYERSSKDVKDLGMKETSWQEIANILNSHPASVQQKWKDLKDKYCREKRLSDAESTSGSGSSSRKKFPYFKEMSFLEPHLRKTKTQNNFNEKSPGFSGAKNEKDISNKRSKNDKPPSRKKIKIKTENNEDIKTTLVSRTKVAEKILDKNKSDKENQAPGNDNSTFINYISSQLDTLSKKKRQELEAKILVLVNNVVLEEMSKDDQ